MAKQSGDFRGIKITPTQRPKGQVIRVKVLGLPGATPEIGKEPKNTGY